MHCERTHERALALTEPDSTPEGISTLILETRTPGFHAGKPMRKLGNRCGGMCRRNRGRDTGMHRIREGSCPVQRSHCQFSGRPGNDRSHGDGHIRHPLHGRRPVDDDARQETRRRQGFHGQGLCFQSAIRHTSNAKQIFGGAGYTAEYPLERYFRDARAGSIGGGTTQIRSGLIARSPLK